PLRVTCSHPVGARRQAVQEMGAGRGGVNVSESVMSLQPGSLGQRPREGYRVACPVESRQPRQGHLRPPRETPLLAQRCVSKKTTTTGIVAMTEAAKKGPQAVVCSPMKSASPMGRVKR